MTRELFDNGPVLALSFGGGASSSAQHTTRRIAVALAVGWLPLAILAGTRTGGLADFLSDFAVHARSLFAVPMLMLADAVCVPRLGAIALHFRESGLVTDRDRRFYCAAGVSTARLRDSTLAQVVIVVLAYLLVACVSASVPLADLPEWRRIHDGGVETHSAAGWWHILVSIPLLLALVIGWIWRLALWTRFLCLMARLDLQLVPAHPDQAAGLKFVGYSVRVLSLVAAALSTVVAGTAANGVMYRGESLADHKYAIAVTAAALVVVFCAPLVVFSHRLLREWRRGVFQYGALAGGFGRQFERKWFGANEPRDESMLERQDFSAATDLYQVVDRVHEMHFIPVDARSVLLLVIAVLLPFMPVALMAFPFDEIVSTLTGLLL